VHDQGNHLTPLCYTHNKKSVSAGNPVMGTAQCRTTKMPGYIGKTLCQNQYTNELKLIMGVYFAILKCKLIS